MVCPLLTQLRHSGLISVGGRLCAISHSLPGRKVLGFRHCTRRVLWGIHATARVHQSDCWLSSGVATYFARAAGAEDADDWLPGCRLAVVLGLVDRCIRRAAAGARLGR